MTNIYNINDDKIEIFNLLPKKDEIEKFKKEELLTIPREERVLIEEPNRGWLTTKKGVIYECGSFILRKSKLDEIRSSNLIINDYISGDFQEDRIVARYNGNNKHLFLLEPYYPISDKQINLTKDLYLLFQLQNSEYSDDFLQTEDLSKIKDLFILENKPFKEINLEELINTYTYIEQDSERLEDKLNYLEDSTKIYKKIK